MDPDTILCIRVAAPSNSELVKERGIGVKNYSNTYIQTQNPVICIYPVRVQRVLKETSA